MKLEKRSLSILAQTKAKAKMYEFKADSTHINFAQEPQNLLVHTIGILGDLSALISRANLDFEKTEPFITLQSQLISVGQFFEALDYSQLTPSLENYLKLVSASSYYLADMPGSASVLINKLNTLDPLTPSNIENALIWLLKLELNVTFYCSPSYINNELCECIKLFHTYFIIGNIEYEGLFQSCARLREIVYQDGTVRELLFTDVFVAIIKRKIMNSSRYCLPRYSNIPIEQWNELLRKPSFIKEFWPAQHKLGETGILMGKSAVIQMPTSAGKTKSTELIIRSAFLSKRANIAVIIAPFKALCREITDKLITSFLGENISVNELQDIPQFDETDLIAINSILNEDSFMIKKNTVVISTPEKLIYLLRHQPTLSSHIDLLIFDEGHQFDSGHRGVTYELLLATLKFNLKENIQIILLSAVIANAESIGDWLCGEGGTVIHGYNCLPTVRTIAFTSWKDHLGRLEYVDPTNIKEDNFFVPRVIEAINLGKKSRERYDRIFPKKNNTQSIAAYLGIKLCHQGPVAIFCGSKKAVTSICTLLIDSYSRNLSLPSPLFSSNTEEILKLRFLAEIHFGKDSFITKSIALGILPHSANIPTGIRASIEWTMQSNKACLVVCTSTLAQGVNLPIKYLIVSSIYQAGMKISTRDFHNLIGRAGRSGLHTEGSIIFSDPDIYDKKESKLKKWKWEATQNLLNFKNSEDCLSSLKKIIEPLSNDAIFLDGLRFVINPQKCRDECIEFSKQKNIDISSILDEMDARIHIINAIESYMLSYLKDTQEEITPSFFESLLHKTLAYYLSSSAEKNMLTNVFTIIAFRVLEIKKEKIAYFGKTLLGIADLKSIEAWLEDNYLCLVDENNPEKLLIICWELICTLSKNKKAKGIAPTGSLLLFACNWINGISYYKLYEKMLENKAYCQTASQQRRIDIDIIMTLSDNFLGYEVTLIVGAIADIIEIKFNNLELARAFRFLQTSLKLGLSSGVEHWLFRNGFPDRELCKEITNTLGLSSITIESMSFIVLRALSKPLKEILSKYPSYFQTTCKI